MRERVETKNECTSNTGTGKRLGDHVKIFLGLQEENTIITVRLTLEEHVLKM